LNKFQKIGKIIFKVILVFFALIGITATVLIANLIKTPKELLTAISTYQIIKSSFYQEVNDKELVEGISRGMAASLKDPYSTYYTKAEITEFNEQLNGIYAGIGMVLGLDKETNLIKSVRIFKNSPAEKAGLLPGDIIVEIDGKSAEGMDTETVALNVKGPEGSKVNLVVFRGNEYLDFEITREVIKVPSVTSKFLDEDTLYIEISTFNENTSNEFRSMLSGLEKEPGNIILDLRDNGGGLLVQAVELARYFTPGGVVLYETGRNQKNLAPFIVDGTLFLNKPLVVLVNENSASASEVLAGAIQDYKAGTLIGDNTFGKALVQNIYPLPTGGALKLTTQRYLTPNKRDLSKEGLIPDIKLVMTEEDYRKIDYTALPDINNDLQLIEAINYFKK
jgi:carboxyl-terminal processing protease